MTVNVRVSEKDLGLLKFVDGLRRLAKDNTALFIGVQFPDRRYRGGKTVGEVALLHEFGSDGGKVPATRFIRGTFERNKTKYANIFDEQLGQALDRGGKVSARSLFTQIGPIVRNDMRDAVRTFRLIDTGLLLSSVGYRISKKGAG